MSSQQAPAPPVTFPVGRVLVGAAMVLFERRGAFAQALALPLVVSFVDILAFGDQEGMSGILLGSALLVVAVHVVMAVNVTRLVLIGSAQVPALGLSLWTMRHWRYLGWYLFQVFCAFMVVMTLAPLTALGTPFIAVVVVVAAWAWGRASLLLPGAALDQPLGLRRAWELGRGNGWRLTLLALGIPCAMLVLLAPVMMAERVALILFAATLMQVLQGWIIAAQALAWQTLQQRAAAAGTAPAATSEALAGPAARAVPRVAFHPDAARGTLEVSLSGPFSHADLGHAAAGETLLAYHGRLRGVLIELDGDDWLDAQGPRWDALDTLLSHLGFVRVHHEHVRRVALVAAPEWATRAQQLGKHFGRAEVRYFTHDGLPAARTWAAGEEAGPLH